MAIEVNPHLVNTKKEHCSGWSVLLCTDYLPPAGGGVEVVVEKLAIQLANQGAEVIIFTLQSNERPSVMDVENVTVHSVPTVDMTNWIGLQSQLSLSSFSRMRRIIKSLNPDIIHIHNRFFFTSFTTGALSVLQQVDAPLVITLHIGKVDKINGFSGTVAKMYEQTLGRVVLSNSDAVVAVSNAVAEHANSLGADPTSTYVVPNGVDSNEFTYSETDDNGKTVLFIGRLVRNKGPQTLVEAIPGVIDSCPDAKFEIVGTGPMENSLKKRVDELCIGDYVTFRGHVDSVSEVMETSDIFCRPSLSEGMPLTLLEAMSSGLPAVVTPVAGVPEIVQDDETGILVEPDDSTATAEALVKLLKNPSIRRGLSKSAREDVVQKHSWERRTEQIRRVYKLLIDEME